VPGAGRSRVPRRQAGQPSRGAIIVGTWLLLAARGILLAAALAVVKLRHYRVVFPNGNGPPFSAPGDVDPRTILATQGQAFSTSTFALAS
jgi:hypothetical protein